MDVAFLSCNHTFWLSQLPQAQCYMLSLQEITLSEALTGTMFYVQHLDGRVLEVSSLPGEVIKPDSWKCINEEGMPVHGRPFEKGNLYIRFAVKFPDSLSSEEVEQLKQVLPAGAEQQVPMSEDEPEQVSLAICVAFEPFLPGCTVMVYIQSVFVITPAYVIADELI